MRLKALLLTGRYREAAEVPDVTAKDMVNALYAAADDAYHVGDLDAAREGFRELCRRARSDQDEERIIALQLRLAGLDWQEGNYAAARQQFAQLRDRATDPATILQASNSLGVVCRDMGDYATARRELTRVLESRSLGGPTISRVAALNNLAKTEFFAGQLDEAERLYFDAIRQNTDYLVLERRHVGATSYGESLLGLGWVETKRGNYDRALILIQTSLVIRRRLLDEDNWLVGESESSLGKTLGASDRGSSERARELLEAGYHKIAASLPPASRTTDTALQRLIDFHDQRNEPELAAKWRQLRSK